jgi:type I restriction enzyme S subunit
MQQYSSYKPSNVEWLGDVPSHWKVDRIKDIFVDNSTNVNIDALKKIERVAHYSIPAFDNGKQPEIVNGDEIDSNKTVLSGNQLLFSRLNSHKPRVWLILEDNEFKVCSTEFFIHRNEDKKANLKFFEYLLTDESFIALVASYQSSVTNSHKRVAPKDYYNLSLPLPPFTEQTAIAAYLDQATANIDRVIATKQQQLEKLEQYKQSKIHECVTKGLNPDVTFKPSGIDWIGDVPNHWKVEKIKRRMGFVYGFALKEEDRIDGEFNVYGSNGIVGTHELPITDGETIIIGRKGTAGALNYSYEPCYPIDTAYFIDKHATELNIRFLFYALQTLDLDKMNEDSAVPGLSRENAYQKQLAFPPKAEQKELAEFLDDFTNKISLEKNIIEQQIEKLSQYRKCLIHECVTGKRKVIKD